MDRKRERDKLTILIDKEIKEKYKEYCNSKGLIIGKQVEIFLREELKKILGKEDKK